MDATYRLFPWDVEDDPRAASWLRDVGVERVALAATYHGARTITPRHPRHRIIELPDSASFLAGPGPLPAGPFSFERARDALEAVGIRVDTWSVLGHLDGVRSDLPRIQNAYGDQLEHALCLSHESSRAFIRTIAERSASVTPGATLHLEAVGWQPLAHGSLHDKLHGADLGTEAADLFALCICAGCATTAGIDADAARAAVREALDGVPDGDIAPTIDDRGSDHLARLRTARASTARRLAGELCYLALASGAAAVSMSPADAPHVVDRVEKLVDCWGDVERGIANLGRAGGGTAFVDILSGDPRDFAEVWSRLTQHGAGALHVYHAGLASEQRLTAAVESVRSLG